jgi:hypothetical protein
MKSSEGFIAGPPGWPATPGLRRLRLGHLLVTVQIAIAVIIVVAAGLFVRTLSNLQSVEPGFDRNNVLLFQVDLAAGYTFTVWLFHP